VNSSLIAIGVAHLLVIASSAATAQNLAGEWTKEPDTVLGVRVGQPLAASRLPDCPEKAYESLSLCLITARPYGALRLSIGGHPFSYAAISVIVDDSGVVSRLQAWMKSERFGEFREVLIARYGSPTKQAIGEAKNLAGASFKNERMEWIGRRLTITAIERFEKVDESMVIFSDNAAAERSAAERKKKSKDDASKL
jgi:hypothetical protein